MRSSFVPKMRKRGQRDARGLHWLDEFLGLCEQLTIRVQSQLSSQSGPQSERSNFEVLCAPPRSRAISTEPSGTPVA